MTSSKVQVRGKLLALRRTSAQRLRRVTFAMNGREYEAIEQNPEKPRRWGQLAREGRHIVPLRTSIAIDFFAAAVEGTVKDYG